MDPVRRALLLALMLSAAAGCGDDDASGDPARTSAAPADARLSSDLPRPEGAVGSVTGMPAHPGPGTASLGAAPAATPVDPDAVLLPLPVTTEVPEVTAAFAQVEPPVAPAVPAPAPSPVPPPVPPEPPPVPILDLPPEAPEADPDVAGRRPVGTEGATESTTFRTTVEPPPDD